MRNYRNPQASSRLDAAVRELVEALREEVLAEVRAMQAGPPRLLSITEAAKRCGVSRTAFYDLIGRGEIRSHKVGRRRLIAETALQAFIDGDVSS